MGCANTKKKPSHNLPKGPEQVRKDKYGRPMHRARGNVFEQQIMIYDDMPAMAELSANDWSKFIQLTKRAEVKDFSKYVGFNLAEQRNIMLASSRQVLDTSDWNPLTYALVIHEETDLRDYILY